LKVAQGVRAPRRPVLRFRARSRRDSARPMHPPVRQRPLRLAAQAVQLQRRHPSPTARAGSCQRRRSSQRGRPAHAPAADPKPPYRLRHGAFARRQDGPDEQDLGMPPGAVAKQRRERYNDRGEAGGQVQHGGVSWRKLRQLTASFASPPLAPRSPARNGQTRA